jgi:hypothetical protein
MTKIKQRTSFIRGRAEVHFGGAICIEVGQLEDGRYAIAFKEAKEQSEVGEKAGETWDAQVFLVFDHPLSLSYLRDALDNVEYGMKYGKLKEAK